MDCIFKENEKLIDAAKGTRLMGIVLGATHQ